MDPGLQGRQGGSWSPSTADTGAAGSPDAPTRVRSRRRNTTACGVCRARKTKCDNKRPRCSYCERVGAACDGVEGPTLHPGSKEILDRIDRLEQTLLQSGWPAAALPDTRMQQDTSPTAAYPSLKSPTEFKTDAPNLNISFCTVESVIAWPVFCGRYDSVPSLRELMEGGNVPSDTGRQHASFDLESCPRLLDNFFSRIHIKNPVLDEHEVRRWARDMSINGVGWDARSCLVFVLCALGIVSQPFTSGEGSGATSSFKGSDEYYQAEAWFDASQKRIGTLLSAHSGILEAQCFFFSGVYLMHTFRVFAGWPLFLQALAACQSFKCCFRNGFNTASASPMLSAMQGAGPSEESIYWTCFKTELETRLELSLPSFKATDLSYPAFLPSPPMESIKNQDQAWYFYLAEISLRRLANRLLAKILPYSSVTVHSLMGLAECITTFENEAKQWADLLPPQVDIRDNGGEDVLKFILKGHLLNCYELMYWPFVMNAVCHPQARNRGLDQFVTRGLQVCVDRIWKNKPGFQHRHHGTWGMMRSCSRSAFVLVAAKMCGQLDALLPRDWEDAVYAVIELLRYWENEAGDAESRKHMLEDALRCSHERR